MRGLLATVTLVVAATVCTAGTLYDNRCPRNFDLAAAIFPVGQSPKPCYTTKDCPLGQLCCPALSSSTDLCLFPRSGNGPFPGSGHIPHSNGQNPLVNGQCPANFRLAAATFPVGQGPSPCSITRDCPLGQLCCPVIDSVSDLCLPPESGFPGGHILNNKPVVFPGQVASHVHQGRCPPALNLAVVRFSEGLPIYCKTARDCPYRQLCCPAINPTSTICRDPAHH